MIMQAPSLSLEFLGNFLAELTLMEYCFLPYLPSLIAASAVFMAKLTLDSSRHPWVCIHKFILFQVFSVQDSSHFPICLCFFMFSLIKMVCQLFAVISSIVICSFKVSNNTCLGVNIFFFRAGFHFAALYWL